jgi:hypothetical protein
MADDTIILILMNLDPKTRTSFFRETHMPGIKKKLRTFSRQSIAVPSSIENVSDLRQFTKLMRFGGVLTQQEFDSIPKRWETLVTSEEERRICEEFLKMYFDCGFIFGEHLKKIIIFVSPINFELYFEIYKQSVKYDKENAEEFIIYFINRNFDLCLWLSRNDYLTYQIDINKICPEMLKEYLCFDIKNLMLDTDVILEVVLLGIKINPDHYQKYFEMVINLPIDLDLMNVDAITYFVDEIVRRAIFYPYYRKIIEKYEKFHKYAKKSLLKEEREIRKNDVCGVYYKEELEWIEYMFKTLS